VYCNCVVNVYKFKRQINLYGLKQGLQDHMMFFTVLELGYRHTDLHVSVCCVILHKVVVGVYVILFYHFSLPSVL